MDITAPVQETLGGVAYNAPPEELMPAVSGAITKALEALNPTSHGAIVGVATRNGVNGAVIARLPGGFQTVAWIGKNWTGGVVYGAAIKREW